MQAITELTIVNRCLAALGESELNSIEGSTNPMVTNARNTLSQILAQEQSQAWWFNTETVTLHPAPMPDGRYRASADTLELSSERNCNPGWLTMRGQYLYNTDGGEYLTGTSPLKVRIVRGLGLDEIPYTAKQLIQAAAVARYLQNYDGDELKLRQAEDDYQYAYALCMSAHTRAVQANMLGQGGVVNAVVRTRVPYSTWRP